jgi:hypothetical protein
MTAVDLALELVGLDTVNPPGRSAHGSSPPHPVLGEPTLDVGTISGGSGINLVPDPAEAGTPLRSPPRTALFRP